VAASKINTKQVKGSNNFWFTSLHEQSMVKAECKLPIICPEKKVSRPETSYHFHHYRSTDGDQKRSTFSTISEEAADWHELMIPQRTTRPSTIVSANNQTHGLQQAGIPQSQSAHTLLLISHPAEGSRLSWPENIVGQQHDQGSLQMTGSENRTAA